MASEKTIQNRVARNISATDARIDKFILSLQRFLGSSLDDILDRLSQGKKSGIESASILGSLLTELKAKGLVREVNKIREIYAEELKFIRDEFEEQGITDTLTAADKQAVDALISIQSSQTINRLERYGIDVQSQVMRQVIAGQEPDLKQIKKDLTPALEASLRTEITTATAAFNSSITFAKAAELGLNLFHYVGANDKVTRPFCKKLLSKSPAIYTREEIAQMDNGQDLSVYTYRGGYNCRHAWLAITEERAKELGYRI